MVNASVMFLALLLSAQSVLAQTPTPDTILHNGKIFTSNAERPWVEALAIRGERIVAVGASNVILQLAGANTCVHPTWGRPHVFWACFWLRRNPVSRATPPSHPKRVTPAVGRLVNCFEMK